MHQRVKKHLLYYIFLLFLLSIGILLGFQTAYNRSLQIEVLILTALAYISWGIFHHVVEHNITAKIVIEYVLIGILGVVAVLFLIKGGL